MTMLAHRPTHLAALGLLCALLAAPGSAVEPLDPCAVAFGEVEQMICRDPELAALDRTLEDLYVGALTSEQVSAQDKKALQTVQGFWIQGRDDCLNHPPVLECLRFALEKRIEQLRERFGQP